MYKIIHELGSVNKTMKLKFNLMIQNEKQVKQAVNRQDTQTINSFMIGGTEYLKLSPYPYITIDISKSTDRGDAWNANLSVNLNSIGLFIMQKKLKHILNGFQVKSLFYKQDGKLYVNPNIANRMVEYIRLLNKVVKVSYGVVKDEENQEIEYEGVIFMINTSDNYCLLTYDELEYLFYILSKIDLNIMALQAINIYLAQLTTKVDNPWKLKTTFNFSEKQEMIPETPNYPKVEEPSEIPKI